MQARSPLAQVCTLPLASLGFFLRPAQSPDVLQCRQTYRSSTALNCGQLLLTGASALTLQGVQATKANTQRMSAAPYLARPPSPLLNPFGLPPLPFKLSNWAELKLQACLPKAAQRAATTGHTRCTCCSGRCKGCWLSSSQSLCLETSCTPRRSILAFSRPVQHAPVTRC